MTNQPPRPTPPICEACKREVKADELVWRKYEGRRLCVDCDVWASLLFGDDEEEE